jgi:RNA polymerase sigma factor (sigma-70 family)
MRTIIICFLRPFQFPASVMSTSGLPPEALHELYSDHHHWLRSWLRRRLGCAFDAADLTHDTYERLIGSSRTPQPEESRRWLMRIANGLVVDLHRRRRLEIAYLDALAELPESQAPSAEEREIALETLIRIDAALDRMSARVREAFLLSRLDQLTYTEVAQRLNVSVASVQKYMLAAVKACYSAVYESDEERR